MATCPLFPLLTMRKALRVWQESYCESDYAQCARYQRALEGKHAPMNLLPNGTTLTLAAFTPKS